MNDTTTPTDPKKALRHQMLEQRLALTETHWQQMSAALSGQLSVCLDTLGLPKVGQILGFCWPIQREPDLRPLVAHWHGQGVQVVLPVVMAPRQPLGFRNWHPGLALIEDSYGIPTPAEGTLVVPEILILPGNAYDRAGYRLGYGGGFFDRTLAALPQRPLVIGVCFDHALVANVGPESHDQPVDWVVTEKTVFQAGGDR